MRGKMCLDEGKLLWVWVCQREREREKALMSHEYLAPSLLRKVPVPIKTFGQDRCVPIYNLVPTQILSRSGDSKLENKGPQWRPNLGSDGLESSLEVVHPRFNLQNEIVWPSLWPSPFSTIPLSLSLSLSLFPLFLVATHTNEHIWLRRTPRIKNHHHRRWFFSPPLWRPRKRIERKKKVRGDSLATFEEQLPLLGWQRLST